MEDEGPSLPSDYVTILHLKERWLKQQQQHQQPPKSNPNHPQPKDEPKDVSASKIPNKSEYPTKNLHQITNHPKSDAPPHDSATKITNERRNRHQVVKPDVIPNDSASKTVVQVADDDSVIQKQEQNTDQSKSKPSTTKNSSKISYRGRNPRFATNQIPNGGSAPPLEPEPVQKKKQHLHTGGRANRSQEVREPKGETTPFAPAVDDSSHNEPEVVKEKKQHRRNRNQEVREPKGKTTPFVPVIDDSSHNEPEVVKEKKQHKQHRRNRNQEIREPKGETPPFAQNVNDDEPEPVQEKKQHRGPRNWKRNQVVAEPKGETPPFARNVNDDSPHNDSGVVEAAAVKEIRVTNVSQRSNRRYDSRSFYNGRRNGGVRPPFPARIGQTTAVWVKKGESSLN